MRGFLLLVIAVALTVSGCSAPTAAERPVSDEVSLEDTAPSGFEPPQDDPSLERLDDDGDAPADVVRMLLAASNDGRYRDWYSLYATPDVDFATAEREAAEAQEAYVNIQIHETRVVEEDLAFVRLSYEASTTPPDGSRYPVVVEPPGEWWPLHKVAGKWRVQWMPRQ